MTDQKQGRKTSYLRAVSGDMTETPEDLSTNEQSFPSKFYGDRTEGANTGGTFLGELDSNEV